MSVAKASDNLERSGSSAHLTTCHPGLDPGSRMTTVGIPGQARNDRCELVAFRCAICPRPLEYELIGDRSESLVQRDLQLRLALRPAHFAHRLTV